MTVEVIGMPVEGWSAAVEGAQAAIRSADVVAVAPRLSGLVEGLLADGARMISITGDIPALVRAVERAERSGRRVAVVATGDPGLFGIGRALADRLGPETVKVRPAASSVAVAFGRIGLPWDDALVVSAHGRPLEDAVEALRGVAKAAVLTSPEIRPDQLAKALAAAGIEVEHAAVASDLGTPQESVETGDLSWLASSKRPAMSVVMLWNGSGVSPTALSSAGPSSAAPGRAPIFGRADAEFEHRDGMITKADVRSIALARLELPDSGVLWDIGAGSGSVGIEAACLAPRLRVVAVERDAESAGRIAANAKRQEADVEVMIDEAPGCLAKLADPDRVFVGGGGLEILDEAIGRLREGGRIVATFASIDRAAGAATRLGNLTQVAVSHAARLPDGTWRLVANDPVFVCWGPT